jgi:hypothetical protein
VGITGLRLSISRTRSAIRSRLVQRGVALLHAERPEDLVQRRAVHARVLADVEPGEVEAEDLDLAQHVVQVAGGGELAVPRAQAALDGAQVGQQLGRRAVSLRGRRGASRPPARP